MLAGEQATRIKIVLSCEHGGIDIPDGYKDLVRIPASVLKSHRAYDPGALDFFLHLKEISDFSIQNTTCRLLIELNRSLSHRKLFSEFSTSLTKAQKQELIDKIYLPYRKQTEDWIANQIKEGFTIYHFSIHSFTNVFNGVKRTADIGWLYDPQRTIEKEISHKLRDRTKQLVPNLTYRMNYPYYGISDGFTKYLRARFPNSYAGIEIEVNQRLANENKMDNAVKIHLKEAMYEVFNRPLNF